MVYHLPIILLYYMYLNKNITLVIWVNKPFNCFYYHEQCIKKNFILCVINFGTVEFLLS